MKKAFYRVANSISLQGLWYDSTGNFTGLIHNEFDFCMNSQLRMPFDKNIIGWLSATETIKELFNWFSEEDILKLEKHGFYITEYHARDYKKYNNHWIICQSTSEVFTHISIKSLTWNSNEKTQLLPSSQEQTAKEVKIPES